MASQVAFFTNKDSRGQYWRKGSGLERVLVGFVAYYLAIIVLSYLFGSVGGWIAAGLTVAIGLWLILRQIELFFAIFVAFLLTFRYVVFYFGLPSQFDLVPVFLAFASALSLAFGGRVSHSRTGTLVLVLYSVFWIPWIVGAFFTPTTLIQLGISFAWRFHGLFLFTTAYLHPRVTSEWMRRYVLIAAIILATQFPVQVLQSFNLPGSLLPPSETYVDNGLALNADYFAGTFGWLGGDELGILELGAIYILLSYGLIKGFSIRLVGLGILFFVPTIIGDVTFARLGVLLFPVVAILLWFLGKVSGLGRMIRSALLLFLIIVPLIFVVLTLGELYAPRLSSGGEFIRVSNLLDLDAWAYNLSREGTNSNFIYGRQAGRGTALRSAVNEITLADGPQFLFGYGPDSLRVTRSSFFGSTPSGLPTKSVLYSFYGFDRLLLETGIVGTLLFLAVLVCPFIRVLQFVRRLSGGNEKMWGIMYLGVWMIFVATGQYDGGWFEPYQKVMLFWLITAGILSVVDRTQLAAPATGGTYRSRRALSKRGT